jgi:DNA invertase Pin-like site-specific DNA recombinase
MTQAIAYIRVSSNGQVEGTGLDRQRESLEAFAKAAGYELVATYADEGVSGTVDGFDRPGLADLANNVQEGQVIIVENADRIARDLLVGEVILGTFREHGIKVIDCAGVDLTNIDGDPTRTLIRQVLGAVAEFNKSQLVGRLASARRRVKKISGRCEGRKPYDNDEVVQGIVALRERGVSYRAIADDLNEQGVASPAGSSWSPNAVRRIALRVTGGRVFMAGLDK